MKTQAEKGKSKPEQGITKILLPNLYFINFEKTITFRQNHTARTRNASKAIEGITAAALIGYQSDYTRNYYAKY